MFGTFVVDAFLFFCFHDLSFLSFSSDSVFFLHNASPSFLHTLASSLLVRSHTCSVTNRMLVFSLFLPPLPSSPFPSLPRDAEGDFNPTIRVRKKLFFLIFLRIILSKGRDEKSLIFFASFLLFALIRIEQTQQASASISTKKQPKTKARVLSEERKKGEPSKQSLKSKSRRVNKKKGERLVGRFHQKLKLPLPRSSTRTTPPYSNPSTHAHSIHPNPSTTRKTSSFADIFSSRSSSSSGSSSVQARSTDFPSSTTTIPTPLLLPRTRHSNLFRRRRRDVVRRR